MEAPAALLFFKRINHIHNKIRLSSDARGPVRNTEKILKRPIITRCVLAKKRYDFYVLYLDHVYHMADYAVMKTTIPLTQG